MLVLRCRFVKQWSHWHATEVGNPVRMRYPALLKRVQREFGMIEAIRLTIGCSQCELESALGRPRDNMLVGHNDRNVLAIFCLGKVVEKAGAGAYSAVA